MFLNIWRQCQYVSTIQRGSGQVYLDTTEVSITSSLLGTPDVHHREVSKVTTPHDKKRGRATTTTVLMFYLLPPPPNTLEVIIIGRAIRPIREAWTLTNSPRFRDRGSSVLAPAPRHPGAASSFSPHSCVFPPV